MLRILGKAVSINVRKVIWACEEIGIAYSREDWGGEFRSLSDPEFLALNPKALVPVVVDGDVVLTESNTIVRYLAAKHGRTDLLPASPAARAQVEEWMDWTATDFNSAWRYAFLGLMRKNPAYTDKAAIQKSIDEWTKMVGLLDQHLANGSAYVCGAALTAGDIPAGLAVHRWFSAPIPHKAFPHVSAYYARLRERPAFLKATEGYD